MQREGQPRLKGTPRSSTRPHRHHERVAMRDPLRDALSRTRLSSTRRSGASESLCLEAPSRALDDTGWVGVRGGMRGDRARRRRLPTPLHSPTPRRAPSQLSCPVRPRAAARVWRPPTVRDPEPRCGARSFRAGGGCYARGFGRRAPRRGPASTSPVPGGASWVSAGRGGRGQRSRAHSPSLRQSAASTRASTATTLASMAPADGGRTQAGLGANAAAESESAAAGGARRAL